MKYDFNSELLETNKEYAYKDLCKLFCWEVKTGNAKKAQLKVFASKVSYYEKGKGRYLKYIVTEIYSEQKQIEDNRSNNGLDVYKTNCDILLMNMLSDNSNKDQQVTTLFLTKNNIWELLGFINSSFKDVKKDKNKFLEENEISKLGFNDFYNMSYSKFIEITETTLNRLRRQRYINSWYNSLQVCEIEYEQEFDRNGYAKVNSEGNYIYKEVYNHTKPTKEMEDNIIKIEKEVLTELGYATTYTIALSNKYNEFQRRVNKKLKELYNIAYYYKVYEINYNSISIVEEYKRDFEEKKKHLLSNNENILKWFDNKLIAINEKSIKQLEEFTKIEKEKSGNLIKDIELFYSKEEVTKALEDHVRNKNSNNVEYNCIKYRTKEEYINEGKTFKDKLIKID